MNFHVVYKEGCHGSMKKAVNDKFTAFFHTPMTSFLIHDMEIHDELPCT